MTNPLANPLVLAPQLLPAFGWSDLNPLTILGNAAAVAATEGWQAFMTGLWGGGLWLTGFAFQLVDAFTSPDLSEGGVMRDIFPVTFGIGAGLALVLGFVQVGVAAWQRDGKGLARLMVGLAQFMLAWGGMLGVGAGLTVGTAGLTQGMLQVALGSPSFRSANLLKPWDPRLVIDAATATVLGVLGIFLIFSALGYLMVMLVRAGALMVIQATSPISAAGLLSEGTRSWFWKSLRWFIAALMIGPLAALVLGIGKKLTDGVLAGAGQSTQAAVGTAVVGTVLVLLSAFCPLILFRLLAFVDPGTSSGASFRASLDTAGGLTGLIGGQGQQSETGSGAATAQASDGSSQGEATAGTATQGRLSTAMGALGGALGGGAGAGAGAALGPAAGLLKAAGNGISSIGQGAATYGADILGAAGVGHQQPYFGSPASNDSPGNGQPPPRSQQPPSSQDGQTGGPNPDGPPHPDDTGTPGRLADPGPATPQIPPATAPPTPPSPTPPTGPGAGGKGGKPAGGPGGPAGGAGEAGGAAGGVERAAAVAALQPAANRRPLHRIAGPDSTPTTTKRDHRS